MNAILNNISGILFAFFLQYKYWVLFPITVVEGPLITLASGFLVSIGQLNPFIALPIIVVGDVTGDVIYYYIGRIGEKWRFTRWVISFLHFEEKKEKIASSFKDHGGKILLFGKLTHGLGSVFLIGAGYAGMDVWSFILYNLIGTIIKSSILMYVGYLAGDAYGKYARYFESGALWFAGISVAIIIIGFLVQHFFMKKIDKEII